MDLTAYNGDAPRVARDHLTGAMDDPQFVDILKTEIMRGEARRSYEELRLRAEMPERTRQTLAQALQQPPIEPVIEKVLAAEVNLLGGMEGCGKSLLARDWAIAVASGKPWRGHLPREPRCCLWLASEGTHDLGQRWEGQPHLEDAKDRIYVLDPINLVAGDDVDWLLDEYRLERPGLVVFDLIYGMGMTDDNGTKDVFPVLNAMKRISREWSAATLALGHPPHTQEKRFRGSSAWRQWAAVDWQMKDGVLSCEKSKIARRQDLYWSYRPDYPNLRWTTMGDVYQEQADRLRLLVEDREQHPKDSDRRRAARLAPLWGVTEERARKLIPAMKTVVGA